MPVCDLHGQMANRSRDTRFDGFNEPFHFGFYEPALSADFRR